MASEKYTAAKMIEALKATKGMVYVAAKKIGCSPNTVYRYARAYPTVQQAIDNERGEFVDTAELALLRAVQSGEAWAVCFTLKTLGKSRGYVERQEITGKDGGPQEAVTYTMDEWRKEQARRVTEAEETFDEMDAAR